MDLYNIRNNLSMGRALSEINLRVSIYARVSTDHIEQKKSLQNQVEHFQEYILANHNWIYVNTYIDDGISGTSDVRRDDFMKMIEDAKNGLFDLIITKEISRFSRNTLDSIKYTRLLLSYGVAVYFVSDNINTIFNDSELRLTIMASMAQDEVRRLSERVKFGMKRSIERGEILGNDMLYGYKKNKNTGTLTIIESEASVVKKIFELYAINKFSLLKISTILNSSFIKTAQAKRWHSSTISRMLRNPKYKGYYCGRKTEVIDYMSKKIKYINEDDWIVYEDVEKIPPIVSIELWNLANERLSKKKKTNNSNKLFDKYTYSAKIFCKNHNSIFHRKYFRKDKKEVTWVCSEYLKRGKKICDSPNIREGELKEIFMDLCSDIGISTDIICDYLLDIYSGYKEYDTDKILYTLLKEKEAVISKKDKIFDLYITNLLSYSEFLNKNKLLDDKVSEIDRKIDEVFCLDDHFDFSLKIARNNELADILFEKVICVILDKIVASKDIENKNCIFLDIYINVAFLSILEKKYIFKRGMDTVSTKRYEVCYYVNFIFNNQSIK